MATTTKFMTNAGVQIDGNHAPSPAHSTDKRCYQSRLGVRPTTTTQVAFKSVEEGAERALGAYQHVGYTPINNREPTGFEKGIARDQGSMGKLDNSFKTNI